MLQHEPFVSKLERAAVIVRHLSESLNELTDPKLTPVKQRVHEIAAQLTEMHMVEFRKVNPEFVKMEQEAAKQQRAFEEGQKLAEQAQKEAEEEEKRQKPIREAAFKKALEEREEAVRQLAAQRAQEARNIPDPN